MSVLLDPGYRGAVQLVERCGACRLDGTTVDLPGPVTDPAGWVHATAVAATLLHGHHVDVQAVPIAAASGAGDWISEIYSSAGLQGADHG